VPTPAPIGFIAPPPATANIPSVPDGFEPTNGTSYRGLVPRTSELVALPLAIQNLLSFTDYAALIGATAPPLAEVLQTFQVSNEWSSMRNASSAWDAYSRDQEGVAWRAMRAIMTRLKPAFALAVKTNPSVATTYAGLASLLGAKVVSAQKGAATRKKNNEEVADGKTPTHGKAAKARQKAAAKAALAAQSTSATATVPAASSAAPVTSTVATGGANAATPAAPVASPAPAAGSTPGTNGPAHS